jgi:phage baseplate assembly protein W
MTMAANPQRFGTDLHLLVNLDSGETRSPGSDLRAVRRPETGADLAALTGVDNLKQALLLRFLTAAGELAPLGHKDYGSRLHELIGELDTETNRNRAKLYVLQALAGEPRIEKVLSLTVASDRKHPGRIVIDLLAKALDHDTPLNLVFPFSLTGTV